jgi:hypothetical protein
VCSTGEHGTRALFGGFSPLLAREFIYISAITAVNPIVTSWVGGEDGGSRSGIARGGAAAFGVGCTAGVISAPCQTLNAVMKSEAHRHISMRKHLHAFFADGFAGGVQRLYFGALTRSVRCGGAGVLYFGYRKLLAES